MSAAESYTRPVFYYETDRMGIVHHSNYIRYAEEARLDFMRRCGADYTEIEARGVFIPVTDVRFRYRSPAKFGDAVSVETHLIYYNGVRAVFSYVIRKSGTDTVLAEAKSQHCFTDSASFSPVNLKKRLPDISEKLLCSLGRVL